jgi:hypothetical protein
MERGAWAVLGLVVAGSFTGFGCGDTGWVVDPATVDPATVDPSGGAPGTAPPPVPARLLSPLSGSLLSTNQPTFRWTDIGPVTIELCADRACAAPIQRLTASHPPATAPAPLREAGVFFWRVRSETGAISATWEAFAPNHAAALSTALATRSDYDGDGYGDFLLGDRVIFGGPNGYGRALPFAGLSDLSFFNAVGDLNGDGYSDLLRLDGEPQGAFTQTPLFGGPIPFSSGSTTPVGLDGSVYGAGPAGDVDGDGYGDAVAKTRWEAATYMGGTGEIRVAQPPLFEWSQSTCAFGADYDGDGFADAATIAGHGDTLDITRGGPAGFDAAAAYSLKLPGAPLTGGLATVDANGDGYADLAVALYPGLLAILAGSAAGLEPTPLQQLAVVAPDPTLAYIDPVGSGDFNGDGLPDLVTAEGTSGTHFAIHYGTGAGYDPTATPLDLPDDASVTAQSIGDVNGDSFEDLTVGLWDTVTDSGGAQRARVTRYLLLLGGLGGLRQP